MQKAHFQMPTNMHLHNVIKVAVKVADLHAAQKSQCGSNSNLEIDCLQNCKGSCWLACRTALPLFHLLCARMNSDSIAVCA